MVVSGVTEQKLQLVVVVEI